MKGIAKYFDWHGELSRWPYFTRYVYRFGIYIAVILFNFGLNLVIGYEPSAELFYASFTDALPYAAYWLLFMPIIIRRMRAAKISLWWLIVFELLLAIPTPEQEMASYPAYALLVIMPSTIFYLIVLFKPNKGSGARNGGLEA